MDLSNVSKTTVAVGVAGALFIGYCFYFDHKRRATKDFKKKLHEKRQDRENKKSKKGKSKIPDVSPSSITVALTGSYCFYFS